jgi:hypothetical protein
LRVVQMNLPPRKLKPVKPAATQRQADEDNTGNDVYGCARDEQGGRAALVIVMTDNRDP